MKVQIKRLVGKTELVFDLEVESHMEFFRDTTFISDLPSDCGNCKSLNLKMSYSQPKGYEYGEVKCLDCNHRLTFGIRKADHYMFAKQWEAPYTGEEVPQEEAEPEAAPARPAAFGRTAAPATPAAAPKAAPTTAAPKAAAPKPALSKPVMPSFPKASAPKAPAPAPVPAAAEVVNDVPEDSQPVAEAQAEAAPKAPAPAPGLPNLDDRVSKLKQQYGIPTGLNNLRR